MLQATTRDPLCQKKFESKNDVGFYTIVRRTRNGKYQLRDENDEILDRDVSADEFKLVMQQRSYGKDVESDVSENKNIKQYRGRSRLGIYEYQVKWKGFRELPWEPETNVCDTTLISDYRKNQ